MRRENWQPVRAQVRTPEACSPSPLLTPSTLRTAATPSLCLSHLAPDSLCLQLTVLCPGVTPSGFLPLAFWLLHPLCLCFFFPSLSIPFFLCFRPHPSPLRASPCTRHQNAPVCSTVGLPPLPAFVSDSLNFMALWTPPLREGRGEAWADQGEDLPLRGSTVVMDSGRRTCTGLWLPKGSCYPFKETSLETPQSFTTLVTKVHFCFPNITVS